MSGIMNSIVSCRVSQKGPFTKIRTLGGRDRRDNELSRAEREGTTRKIFYLTFVSIHASLICGQVNVIT